MAHLQRVLLETVSMQIHFLMKKTIMAKNSAIHWSSRRRQKSKSQQLNGCIYTEEGTFSQHNWYQKKQPLFLYQDSTVTQ